MATTKNTPFRIPDQIKTPAQKRADAEGVTLAAVVRDLLADWARVPRVPSRRPDTKDH